MKEMQQDMLDIIELLFVFLTLNYDNKCLSKIGFIVHYVNRQLKELARNVLI